MAAPTLEPSPSLRHAYDLGSTILRYARKCDSFWGEIEPGIDESFPHVLPRYFFEVRDNLAKLISSLASDPTAVDAGNRLSDALEQTWAGYQAAWKSPEHAAFANAYADADPEWSYLLFTKNRPTKLCEWRKLKRCFNQFLQKLQDPFNCFVRLGLSLRALELIMESERQEFEGWLPSDVFKNPCEVTRGLLQELSQHYGDRISGYIDLSSDAFLATRRSYQDSYEFWLLERSQEIVQKVIELKPEFRDVVIDLTLLNRYALFRKPDKEFLILSAYKDLFASLIRVLKENQSVELVSWTVLNEIVARTRSKRSTSAAVQAASDEDEDRPTTTRLIPTHKASDVLRKTVSRLNLALENHLGPPPGDGFWLETVRGEGLRLNRSCRWQVSQDLSRFLRSPSIHPSLPGTDFLEQSQPDRKESLPVRRRRTTHDPE